MKLIAFTALFALPLAAPRAQSTPAASTAALAPSSAAKAEAAKPDPWPAWKFLAGDWSGEGSGTPGQGAGAFSFKFELEGKILVRRNRADYPATKERPAFHHEDLLTLYPDPADGGMKADYFDNEGHVIHYSAAREGADHWVFFSDPAPGPRFRLTYAKLAEDRMEIKFEVAGPQPGAPFKPYITATAKRVK